MLYSNAQWTVIKRTCTRTIREFEGGFKIICMEMCTGWPFN